MPSLNTYSSTHNLKTDGPEQQNTRPVTSPVSKEDESEAAVCTGSPNVGLNRLKNSYQVQQI